MLPKGFEELPDQPGAVGVRAGGMIVGLLGGMGAICLLGGIALCFAKAKESAQTDTLWPVGVVFIALGLICLLALYGVTRGPKYVFDDVGLHSRAVFGRSSVHWEHIEKVQPVRGAVFITAPGGIHARSGKLTRKKTLRLNTQGLRCPGGAFVSYVNARVAGGGRAPS